MRGNIINNYTINSAPKMFNVNSILNNQVIILLYVLPCLTVYHSYILSYINQHSIVVTLGTGISKLPYIILIVNVLVD